MYFIGHALLDFHYCFLISLWTFEKQATGIKHHFHPIISTIYIVDTTTYYYLYDCYNLCLDVPLKTSHRGRLPACNGFIVQCWDYGYECYIQLVYIACNLHTM